MVLVASHRISPVPWYSGTPLGQLSYTYRAFTFYGAAFQSCFDFDAWSRVQALQPQCRRNDIGLGCSPFARHYLGNHYCFLFLRVLRCFSSPGLLPLQDATPSAWRVAPFGNLRIKGCLHLPEAYRSLSRPSSPLRA